MRSVKNNSVNVVVNDRQDRVIVAGTVELRTDILLSAARLLGSVFELPACIGAIQITPVITTMPTMLTVTAMIRRALRHWHPGYRYSATCFACSS